MLIITRQGSIIRTKISMNIERALALIIKGRKVTV